MTPTMRKDDELREYAEEFILCFLMVVLVTDFYSTWSLGLRYVPEEKDKM